MNYDLTKNDFSNWKFSKILKKNAHDSLDAFDDTTRGINKHVFNN